MMMFAERKVAFLWLLLLGALVDSFVLVPLAVRKTISARQDCLLATNHDDDDAAAASDADEENPMMTPADNYSSSSYHMTENSAMIGRRKLFQKSAAASISAITLSSSNMMLQVQDALAEDTEDSAAAAAAAAATIMPGSLPNHPVVVLGGGGKTGKLCTEIMARQGLYVRCVTRTGRKVLLEDNDDDDGVRSSNTVSYAAGDATKYDQMRAAVKGASSVIFAASASGKNQGGDPARVDYLGVYQTAKACIEQQVPKLILISAATTTRPDSIGFKATTAFVQFIYGDKIMDYKIAGEAVMRDLYANANNPALSYSVIRPGKQGW